MAAAGRHKHVTMPLCLPYLLCQQLPQVWYADVSFWRLWDYLDDHTTALLHLQQQTPTACL
jgi:hypothetical protein